MYSRGCARVLWEFSPICSLIDEWACLFGKLENRSLIYLRNGKLAPTATRHKQKSVTLHTRARQKHLISHSAQPAHSIQTLYSPSCLTAYIRLIPASIHQSINKQHTL